MGHLGCSGLIASMLLLAVLGGCEEQVEVSEANVVGTWTGSYDFMPMTLTFNADNTFTYINGPPKGGEPKVAWMRGRFADLPELGTWRIASGDEPEMVWMLEGGMVDSAFIRKVTPTNLTLQFEGKPPVNFEKQ